MESAHILPVEKDTYTESNGQVLQQKIQIQQEEIQKYLNVINNQNAEIEDLKNKLKAKTAECEQLTEYKTKQAEIIDLVKNILDTDEKIKKEINEFYSSEIYREGEEIRKKYFI